jgi:hypothetical protein
MVDPGHIPGPVVIPNCAMFRIRWGLTNGKVANNVLHAQWTGSPVLTPAIAETARQALVAGAGWSGLAAFLATGTTLAGVDLLDMRAATNTIVSSTGAATPGTSASTAIPSEVAIAVTLRSATRGPSGRGRFFVPGLATNAIGAGDVVAGAAITALTTWLGNINTAAGPIGPLCIALPARQAYTSADTGRIFPARGAGVALVNAFLVRDNHWDSQRRRGLR